MQTHTGQVFVRLLGISGAKRTDEEERCYQARLALQAAAPRTDDVTLFDSYGS